MPARVPVYIKNRVTIGNVDPIKCSVVTARSLSTDERGGHLERNGQRPTGSVDYNQF